MSENKIKIKISKNEMGKILDCKIEKVKKNELEKKEKLSENAEMENEDVEMEMKENLSLVLTYNDGIE